MTIEYQHGDDLICRTGHPVISNEGRRAKHCPFCGDETISACDACNGPLPKFTGDVAAIGYCTDCGAPYPWHRTRISNAKRTMEIAARSNNWDDETLQLGYEFVEDLGKLQVPIPRIKAVFAYLRQFNLKNYAFVDVARVMGTASIQKWLDENESFPF